MAQLTSNAARNFGFGGAAQEGKIQQGINDFADAHLQSISTDHSLQQQNAQLSSMLQQNQQHRHADANKAAAAGSNGNPPYLKTTTTMADAEVAATEAVADKADADTAGDMDRQRIGWTKAKAAVAEAVVADAAADAGDAAADKPSKIPTNT